jgi:non-canonical purine NTP pyrophosphatase (RdgB/HAM1 family)
MINKLVLVSGNKNKAQEVKRILKIPIEIINLDIDEIQSMDPQKITLHKLEEAYNIVGKPLIVDDVSFEVDIWNGFPGPLIKWLLEEKNDPTLMLRMMSNETNRKATAKLFVGLHDGKNAHIFTGEVKGNIAREIRGDNGFGWDKVFIPDDYTQTFAQMQPALKDSMSHRGRALKKVKEYLDSQVRKNNI